jgi:CrcB protein
LSVWVWLGVAALGAAGASGRFVLDSVIGGLGRSELPLGTFAVNLTGAFALGLLTGLAVGGELLVLAGTAALGSYTTFSTWMLETHRLAEDGRGPAAAINAVGALCVGVGAAALGRLIGAQL